MPWNRTPTNPDNGGNTREVMQKCPKCGEEIWSLPADKRMAKQVHMGMAHDHDSDDDE